MQNIVKQILVDPERCTGCRRCEAACSLVKAKGGLFSAPRIHVASVEERGIFHPIVCRQCASPDCVEVCPTGALSKSADGITRVDEERCVGCKMCVLACPYKGILYSEEGRKSVKCDQCDGRPECVAQCTTGALTFQDLTETFQRLKERPDLISPGLSACQGCPSELAMRFIGKVIGKNMVMGIPPGCMSASGVLGFGASTGARFPIFFALLGNTAPMLTGIRRALLKKGKKMHVVGLAGDGATADIGFQSLSAAAERGDNIIYICYDNEAYMNTGIQRSSTTPFGSWTTTTPVGDIGRGKRQKNKDLPMIMAMHDLPYMATACTSYLNDFREKLEKAMEVREGLAYLHLFSPCPIGWRFPTEESIEIGRLAVETNFFPLYEVIDSKFRMTVRNRFPISVEQYTKRIGKYSHLRREELGAFQKIVDDRYNRLLAMTNLVDTQNG
jgi:phenylglyoxylate dehydrogenase beta subunit